MTGKKILNFLLLAMLLAPIHSFSSESNSPENTNKTDKTRTEIKEYIDHHLLDSYDFTIWHAAHLEFPLPIILFDEGLQIFSSSRFHNENHVAEYNGKYYTIDHHNNKIYRTDAAGTLTMGDDNHPTQVAPLNLSITKNVVSILIFSILIFVLFKSVAKSYGDGHIPNKLGRFLEPLVIFVRDDIAIPNIGEKHYRKYMGYILTVFFFIWFINLAGLTPLGINVTGNIAVTFFLALLTFLITQFTANKHYWGHIFWNPSVPALMRLPLAAIELLGVFIKPFSLMIRLYANMTAGHVVIMSLISLIYVFGNAFASGSFLLLTLFLSVIELLVAFLQAYIFAMLTALYFGAAVEEHDHH